MHPSPGKLIAFAASFPLLIASGVAADDGPTDAPKAPPAAIVRPIEITDVQPSQSCGGEWDVTMLPSEDGHSVMALLSTDEDWEIAIGPDGITAGLTSNCTLTIGVKKPKGVSYTLTKVSYEGHTALDEGMFAEQTAAYGFVGGPISAHVVQDWTGPLTGSAALDAPFLPEDLIWSSCEAPTDLQVRASLYLRNTDPQGNGTLSMAITPGVTMLVLEFATRPCASPAT